MLDVLQNHLIEIISKLTTTELHKHEYVSSVVCRVHDFHAFLGEESFPESNFHEGEKLVLASWKFSAAGSVEDFLFSLHFTKPEVLFGPSAKAHAGENFELLLKRSVLRGPNFILDISVRSAKTFAS